MTPTTRAAWETLLDGTLRGRSLTRVLVTHYHPDHIGLAGWLCERFGTAAADEPDRIPRQPQHPSRAGRAQCRALPQLLSLAWPRQRDHRAAAHQRPPLPAHDLRPAAHVSPPHRRRIAAHRRTHVRGPVGWRPRPGAGHAVLPGGKPAAVRRPGARQDFPQYQRAGHGPRRRPARHLSAFAGEPETRPAGRRAGIAGAQSAVCRPGYPHRRALCAPRGALCRRSRRACRRAPCTAADLVPVVFRRVIDDPHQMGFAFSEGLAHVNYLLRENRLRPVAGSRASVEFTA